MGLDDKVEISDGPGRAHSIVKCLCIFLSYDNCVPVWLLFGLACLCPHCLPTLGLLSSYSSVHGISEGVSAPTLERFENVSLTWPIISAAMKAGQEESRKIKGRNVEVDWQLCETPPVGLTWRMAVYAKYQLRALFSRRMGWRVEKDSEATSRPSQGKKWEWFMGSVEDLA